MKHTLHRVNGRKRVTAETLYSVTVVHKALLKFMKTKALLGTLAALALVAGVGTNVASAREIGIGADASVHASQSGSGHGFRGALQSFFSRHKGDDDTKGPKGDDRFERQDKRLDDRIGLTFGIGTVTAVDGDVITATTKKHDKVTWKIATDSDTTFAYKGDKTIDVGDRIAVAGDVTDKDGDSRSIDATYVLVVDADYAMAHGTITDVDEKGNTVTIETKHQGDVTVAIDSDTAIVDEDGDDGVFADLVVGAKVRITGMWNSLHDIVTAAKVRILD